VLLVSGFKMRHNEREIISSSSVGITRIVTRPASAEITAGAAYQK